MKATHILIKLLLGGASILWPITFLLMWLVVGPGIYTRNIYLMALIVITILSLPSLMVFYIFNIYKSNSVAKDKRNLWAALLFFGNILVYPVYWYLYIWREHKKPQELQASQSTK